MHHLVSYSQCKGVDHFHAEVPAVAPCSFPVFAGQSLKHHTFAFHRLISLEKCPTDTSKPWPFNCGPRGRMYSAGVRQRVSLPKIYGQATNESTNQLHLHILICGPISVWCLSLWTAELEREEGHHFEDAVSKLGMPAQCETDHWNHQFAPLIPLDHPLRCTRTITIGQAMKSFYAQKTLAWSSRHPSSVWQLRFGESVGLSIAFCSCVTVHAYVPLTTYFFVPCFVSSHLKVEIEALVHSFRTYVLCRVGAMETGRL